jgi:AhpD family alkylhydroperoxidase
MNLSDVAPAAYRALIALDTRSAQGPLPSTLLDLVRLRASQINGCAYCVDSHSSDLRSAGESEGRIAGVAAWQEGPFFTADERAALDLTETMTRLSEGGDRVPQDVWDTAHKALGDEGLGQLVMVVATINAWNRIGVTTRMVPESYAP